MHYSFLIIADDIGKVEAQSKLFSNFPNYFCAGIIENNIEAIEQICSLKPQLILLFGVKDNGISFSTIQEMHQYIDSLPYIIFISSIKDYALEAIRSGVSDYLNDPINIHQLGKSLFKFEKRSHYSPSSTLCIKSYSDYQFLSVNDIVYLKADNNTTDIKLINGKIINAFKTLKYFEHLLPFQFLRIHKSYIVNIDHVSRIHLSKSKCYLNYNEVLPFSLGYKSNIDAIIRKINVG